jgi:hypothetical protein
MQPQSGETFQLVDAQQRRLGWMALESNDGGLLSGTFTPGPDYPAVRPLFRAFEEAAELQALSAVDRLDATLASLGLRLCPQGGASPVPVHDVQIWSDGGMTCRVGAPAPVPLNGSPPGSQAATGGEGAVAGQALPGAGGGRGRES